MQVVDTSGTVRDYPVIRYFDYRGRTTATRFTSDFPCIRVYSDAVLNSNWNLEYTPNTYSPTR